MADKISERFAEALQRMEESGDVQELVDLFAPEATLSSPERDVHQERHDGIRGFWTQYLGSFQSIRSRFHRIREAERLGVLEWESEGTLQNGDPVHYRGVSLLDIENGRVQHFATYYDTRALTTSNK